MVRVGIIGVGLTKMGRRNDVNHVELCYEAVKAALSHADLTIDDIEAIVYGTMDPFDGLFMPERFDSSALGLARERKPMIKVSTGGTTGLSTALAAYYNVASGLFDIVMAVGVQKVSESLEAQQVLNTAVDPIYDRPFGVGAIAAAAFQAARYMHDYKATEEHLAMIAVKNRKNALRNPYAHLKLNITIDDVLRSPYLIWPLRLLDSCPSSDGAVAIIFASESIAKRIKDNPAWILATGYISDSYWFGSKPTLGFWDNLAILARRLYRKVGIDNPLKELDVAELYDAFTIQEIMEYEAFGFAERGEGYKLLEDEITMFYGELPVNPSGGVLSTNPVGATGLVRVAEAALQIMGEAGRRQIPNVKTALAHAWGGALQFHAAMILGREFRR